ncbi:MAG TPA: hypothetical protein VMH87_10345 [Pseudomonadales bacterium]|nr:hypothetical protein [Pseudomonadales bacterium]
MFPLPFQYFRWVDFYPSEFFMAWAICGVILGGPVLLFIFFLARMRFFQRTRWQKVAWRLPLMGLIFGLASGWFTAWDDHHTYIAWSNQTEYSNDQPYHWYEIFGEPGADTVGAYSGDFDENGDPDEDSLWYLRSDIAIWNGLFWLSIAIAGVFVFRFAAGWNRPAQAEALPANSAVACGG